MQVAEPIAKASETNMEISLRGNAAFRKVSREIKML
jgi:hypothetical protein